jgi:integrase
MKQRKDGRWEKVKTINGKRISFMSSEPTEKKALKDIENKMLQYMQKQEKGLPFDVVAKRCETQHRENLPEMTYKKTYQSRYREIVLYFGNKYIKDITPKDVTQYFQYLKEKQYSEKTLAVYKVTLNTIFNYAFVNGDVESNFIPNVKNPAKSQKSKRKMAPDEDIEIINNNYNGFGFLPYFVLYTGMRPSEALAIQDTDFDYQNNVIRVNKRIIHYGNDPRLEYQTKTDAGDRYVSLLERVKEKMPKFKGFLFSADGGKTALTKKQLQCRYDKWRKDTGCTCTLYQLRHAYATMLHEANISDFDAMHLMGHSSIQVTKNIYTEIRSRQKAKVTNILNNFEFK